MEITPDKRKLVGLVEQAYVVKLCLPEFQRDFVWTIEGVADLIRSVLRGYYVGSLLLLRCDPNLVPFAPTYLRGVKPPYVEPRPEMLVLDGQQRLTSLIYALTAPDLLLKDTNLRRWFYVDLDLLQQDIYDDEIVFSRSSRDLDNLNDVTEQYKRRILPCVRLMRSEDFLNWRDGMDDWLRENEPEAHKEFRSTWRDAWTKAANQFLGFEIPLVELPRVEDSDTEAIGRVCAIFEKLNSTGVELSVYDLLTARLYRSKIRLHDLWDQACKDHKRLNEWSRGKADTNKFGVLLLRTLALLRGLDPKPAILINLAPEGFEEDWKRAAAAMERALELLTHIGADGFGVFSGKYLPGFGLIPVLAALRAEIESRKLGEEARADLRRWYWCSVFLERYSSAVESKSVKDYKEMLAYWSGTGTEPAPFSDARARIGAPGYSVRDSASYASSVYSGVFCLLSLRGARDWRRGESIQLQKLQDHHIFPKNYLRKHGLPTRSSKVNSIANRTLISDETNNTIKDKAPASYVDDPAIFPSGARLELMEAHFMNEDAVECMRFAGVSISDEDVLSAYDEFLNIREALIVAEIRRVCGVETSTSGD
ncbi:MAG: DUF262 domain-containing protein [Anaerolineae bacterium]|nr:DUF262 domain-containing protein [Anaerolineae bacterium]